MSRICEITGKKPSIGNTRSHANNASKRTYWPNLFVKKVWDPVAGKMVKMKISAAALRTLSKSAR
ncbi:MAG: 50S ribosomal protein L28 [Patescibacteria group bacterium]